MTSMRQLVTDGRMDTNELDAAPRALPDPAVCRAKEAGFGDYTDCLMLHPVQCPYSLSFGDGFLCRHPQRREIVQRTAAQGQ